MAMLGRPNRRLQIQRCGKDVQVTRCAGSPWLPEVGGTVVVLDAHAQQSGRIRQHRVKGWAVPDEHVSLHGVCQAAERSNLGPSVGAPEIIGQALEQAAVLADGIV
eukprot:5172323-Amphidinium_carterae.4